MSHFQVETIQIVKLLYRSTLPTQTFPLFQENGLGLHGFLREKYPLLTKNLFKQLVPRSLKFLVVRHPFERVMSAYVDKLEDYERSD